MYGSKQNWRAAQLAALKLNEDQYTSLDLMEQRELTLPQEQAD